MWTQMLRTQCADTGHRALCFMPGVTRLCFAILITSGALDIRFANYEVSKPAICNGLDKCSIFKVNPSSPMSPELAAHEPDDVSAVDIEAA